MGLFLSIKNFFCNVFGIETKEEKAKKEPSLIEQKPTSDDDKKAKEDKWADVNDPVKFVCQGGKAMCKYHSSEAILMPTSTEVMLQDKPYVTNTDKDGKVNFVFTSICTHPSHGSNKPPCVAVISLGEWKDCSTTHIDDYNPILGKSTIPCMVSGEDLKITFSGQTNNPASVEPNLNNEKIIIEQVIFDEEDFDNQVCHKIAFKAMYFLNGNEKDNQNIVWSVKPNQTDEHRLDELKKEKIIKGKPIATGQNISFVIPKEWGQQTIRIYAYLKKDRNVKSNEIEVYIKDHIVAAFYRIDVQKPKTFVIDKIKPGGGTTNVLGSDPVHHNQGMYKDEADGTIYVSVSVEPRTDSYIYILDEVNKKQEKYKYRVKEKQEDEEDQRKPGKGNKETDPGKLLFIGDYSKYRHPGGIQSANHGNDKILAVGFEKYGLADMGTLEESVIGFFDISDKESNELKEYQELRIIKDPNSEIQEGRDLPQNREIEGDWSSALGIIWIDEIRSEKINKYLTVSRGGNQALEFFLINESGTRIDKVGKKIERVGEFQNVNLIKDELGEIYLVGFESTKKPLGTGYKTNFVWFYKVNFKKNTDGDKIEGIEVNPVWIDDNGLIQTSAHHLYTDDKNKLRVLSTNKRQVITQDEASFQWASCIHLDQIEQEEQDKAMGFKNKMTIYAVSSVAKYTRDEIYESYLREYDINKSNYEMNLYEQESQNSTQWEEEKDDCRDDEWNDLESKYTTLARVITIEDHYPRNQKPMTFEEYRRRMEKLGKQFFVELTFNAFY